MGKMSIETKRGVEAKDNKGSFAQVLYVELGRCHYLYVSFNGLVNRPCLSVGRALQQCAEPLLSQPWPKRGQIPQVRYIVRFFCPAAFRLGVQ